MILNYYDMSGTVADITEYKKKKLDIKVLDPKTFNEYRKQVEDNGGQVVTVRNTKLSKYDNDDDNERDPEFLEIQGYRFKLKKEKARAAKFYIPVGEFEFVRVESWLMLWIILFVLLAGLIGTLIFTLPDKPVPDNPKDPLQIAQNADDITDHDIPSDATSQAAEYTEFPGYAHLHLVEEQPYVYLTNPAGNTVYMVYSIYNGDELIYETDAIEPNKEIKANLREKLGTGSFILRFVQSTYDLTTQATCNGTNQEVDIIIE